MLYLREKKNLKKEWNVWIEEKIFNYKLEMK
jgi:hypothetical protein